MLRNNRTDAVGPFRGGEEPRSRLLTSRARRRAHGDSRPGRVSHGAAAVELACLTPDLTPKWAQSRVTTELCAHLLSGNSLAGHTWSSQKHAGQGRRPSSKRLLDSCRAAGSSTRSEVEASGARV